MMQEGTTYDEAVKGIVVKVVKVKVVKVVTVVVVKSGHKVVRVVEANDGGGFNL